MRDKLYNEIRWDKGLDIYRIIKISYTVTLLPDKLKMKVDWKLIEVEDWKLIHAG